MRKKIGGIPFSDLEGLLNDEFTTYPRIGDILGANPKPKKRAKGELHTKNKGRVCGIYKVGARYVGSIYIRKGTTVFVEINAEKASEYLLEVM